MLWLALHLPWLPLEALQPGGTGSAQALRCVVEQRKVLVADRAAREAGIEPGMSIATAASLAPDMQQLPRDAPLEAEFMRLLALALGRYTPNLVLQADGIALEVGASLRLFGGLRSLMRQVRRTVRGCGARARLGLAPTLGAASLFARVPASPSGRPGRAVGMPRAHRLLDGLRLVPVLAVLRQEERLVELLQSLGCRVVRDVRALPRAGLHRRGGAGLLARLDQAYGDTPDPQRWFEPPERFAQALELMQRADDVAPLLFAADRLVQSLAGWLSRQWLAASRLRLQLRHERNRHGPVPPSELPVELGSPSRDPAQIMALLRERLHRMTLAAPVYALELLLDEAQSLAGHAGQWLPDPGQQAQDVQALLDRLAARLGPDHVLRLAPRPDHRPEKASAAMPAARYGRATPHQETPPRPAARPVWLLPSPLRLTERDGRPVHGSELTLLTRAERIESGWFDDALVCRDYHLATGPDHCLRWIYRERRDGELAWYLHGLFA